MEDDKRGDRNLAKAEAARRLARLQQGTFWIGTERTLTKRRHYNLVFLHARRKTFPAFADIAEALASVWPWGQYRLNTKDVNKRRVFENEVVMLGTFATETSTDVFDDARIEAQSTGSHQGPRCSQIGIQTFEHAHGLLLRSHGTLDDGLAEHLNGTGKTEAIGIQLLAGGRLHQQAAHRRMGQQQGVEFLQDQFGPATAQGLLADALLIAVRVDGLLDFPAMVVAHTDLLSWCLFGIQQGDKEPRHLAHLRIGERAGTVHARGGDLLHLLGPRRIQGVLNNAHLQRSLQALTRLGIQGGQRTAIREFLLVLGEEALRQASQHLGASRTNG